MTKKDIEEVKTTEKMIKYLKDGYGDCDGTEINCVACQAIMVIKFLQEHIDMIYEWDKEV